MLLKLGTFKFSVGTLSYNTLKQSTGYHWVKQELLGRAPIYQSLGQGETTITLDGVIYPDQVGTLKDIENLKKEAGKQIPLPMTDAQGNSHGQWVILSVTETHTLFDSQGFPFKVVFKIELAKLTQ